MSYTNEYLNVSDDKESQDAREFPMLKVGLHIPQPRRLEMPQMSDGEMYLRVNVPDGLQNNGEQPQKYITQVIDSHEGSGSAIRRDPSA
jgi:hypothetical protein